MKKSILLICGLIVSMVWVQAQPKIFGHTEGHWQYIYPFADKSYGLAIEHIVADDQQSINIYFGRKNGKTDIVYWKENHSATQAQREVDFVDYNNDGIKDLLFFVESGARGGNSYYLLYLVDPKKHTLTKVRGFDEIANPSYDQKNKVIVSYGLAGENYYSLHRINKANKVYQIGQSFKDTNSLDLDAKIRAILKNKP
ncbi:hypothetical protein VRU48_05925 [Pedobacter sp. KR3-3]|uniref:VCBS repeat-containing protein n=1 Tax=Pedobacter albus TaxID=3113905 RepID=A0ABU7I5P2_9SPHI|nr:hypothetical protein [Pedobacter sp. KR3-3]MEE1944636.1 hypothetical protein [Pedobacter sp. KR3-3]